MKRTPINVWDYAPHLLKQLPKGALLNTQANGIIDTMTIGWGTLGIDWSEPIFTVFVRESRYTRTLLDQNPVFTVSFPLENQHVEPILNYCGRISGRDKNKFEEMNLTVVEGQSVNSPAIAQLPLTIECKVVYQQDQDPKALDKEIHDAHYPKGDYHTAYSGLITAAYILEDE